MKSSDLQKLKLKYNWEFLIDWNNQLIENRNELLYSDTLLGIDEAVKNNKWLGYDGATEEQIISSENKLSVKFPTSYKEFLYISNGWRYLGTYILRVSCVEDVDWYINKSKEEYGIYIEANKDIQSSDIANLKYTLQITEQIKSELYTYHLNSKSVSKNGEWEAWTFWKYQDLDIQKYTSFYELMLNEYNSFSKHLV